MKQGKDNINPQHYTYGEIETIDYIKQVTSQYSSYEAFYIGNIIKYISRAPRKNGIEDLRKAQWYLDKLIGDRGTD